VVIGEMRSREKMHVWALNTTDLEETHLAILSLICMRRGIVEVITRMPTIIVRMNTMSEERGGRFQDRKAW